MSLDVFYILMLYLQFCGFIILIAVYILIIPLPIRLITGKKLLPCPGEGLPV